MIELPDIVLFVFGMNAGASVWLFSLSALGGTGLQFVLSLMVG